jgi:ubiquinone/menaquinone biosynthesis C-methylase UbiE
MNELASLYRHRFPEDELPRKRAIWKVLCAGFFQKFVRPTDVVLDLACGHGDFINNIAAAEKHAIDLNPDSPRFVDAAVRFHKAPATDLGVIADATMDVVFTSNFLEHLPDKTALGLVLAEVRRVLKPNGRFLVLGPNIRYLPGAYWDFLDHHLPLTHNSLAEALVLSGFEVEAVIDRFLPYTTRSRLPQTGFLVSLYLKMPVAWRFLGKQFFVRARKPGPSGSA